MGDGTRKLLRRVAARERACALAERFYLFLLVLAGGYAALLLCSRLLAIIPNWFVPINLVSITAAALACAIAFHRRPAPSSTARLIDVRMQTHDLFLTGVLIDTAVGAYKPLVVKEAEERAARVEAKRVVPFRWAGRARNAALAMAALLAAVVFLPQLDPFGKEEERQRMAGQRRQLESSRKATALRAALLKKRPDTELSREVAGAVEELKQTFNAAKPTAKEGNLRRLSEQQARLGELWRKASEKRLKEAFRPTEQAQRFGSGQKAAQWRQELQRGQTEGLKKEIDELKDTVAKLARMGEGAEKRKLAEQVQRALERLADSVGGEAGSKALAAALDRALEQLAMAGIEGLSAEALGALQESLDLAELELDALAQSMRDLQALEDALTAAQLAKLLNELELLDGEACSGCKGIGDYAALYAELMAGRCGRCGGKLGADGICGVCGGTGAASGAGAGMGGPGMGEGNIAPEKPDAETDFKTEKSRSALTAGKMLLSLKSRGVSEAGEAVVDYERHLRNVKQGVAEAILQERVPPAYHEAIRRYFDTMGETNEGTGQK